ncbi:MAG: DUF1553 domain-containing protein [Planctomycetes bacterium]|nr:DUF1553 domain-containing protein [Planctomycetota bacterium]
MRIRIGLPFVAALAISSWFAVHAADEPKPADAGADPGAEAKAKADYDVAQQAADAAAAALGPLRATMQAADTAYANASKTAQTKRQQATDAKNLAGEPGTKELAQAEANVPVAEQALTDVTNAKPGLDQALADAKAAALPLQQTFDAAEKAAKEAEAAARVASEAANKLDDEAKKATAQADAKRRAADTAKAALTRAQQNEQQATAQAGAAAQKLPEVEAAKQAADDALATAKNQVAAAESAYQAAEQAAAAAEANATVVSEAENQAAAADAAAKRKAADEAKAALAQAKPAEQNSQKLADAAAQKLARATAQRKLADASLVNVKNQIVTATTAAQVAEEAAQAAAAFANEKNQAAAQAAAKRKAAADAAAALAATQQGEQQAQTQATAAAQSVTDAQAQMKAADEALTNAKTQAAAAATAAQDAEQTALAAEAKAKQFAEDAAKPDAEKKQAADEAAASRQAAEAAKTNLAQAQQSEQAAQTQAAAAAQKLAEAEAQKKSSDEVLANAKNQVAAATAANQAAQEAASELIQLDVANRQAAADAAAKRQAADAAKAALAPVQQTLEQAAVRANTNAQELARAEARKKATEEALANLKTRIAAAIQTHVADEQAAVEAEAAAVPLKAEAEQTRAAYLAAVDVADQKRTLAEQAKAILYRLVAARQVASLTESLDPPKPANRIDEIIFAKLKTLGIEPSLCSDAVFVRRAYLDVTGKLPTADEAKAFIQDADANKRIALIDRLLDRSSPVDYWAMKWSDILRIKAEFPVKIWPNAAQAYHRWVWESIAQNKPYDQFARELLTSNGSNFRDGPVNFYRAIQDRTPEGTATAAGLAFMGTRIHLWPEDRRAGMAVFFSQIGYKPTSEWKEEIVFWDPLKSVAVPGSIAPGVDAVAKSVTATNQIPRALAEPLSENGPLAAVFPDGTQTTIPPNRDPREVFADWLIRPENPWFARTVVNRTWAWAMGRGIIHEPDDIREDNPPSNPELLAYLEQELVSSGYDLKRLKRLIFTSTVYQFSSVPRFKTPEARANFASYLLRRVEAEVLNDALNEITGSTDLYTSAVPEPFTYIPQDMTAVEVADGSITSSFLTLFGRSARATGMESERVNELASPQWLYTLNSAQMQGKLQNGPKLAALLAAGGSTQEIAERLYLTVLSRFPTEADVKAAEEYAKTGVTQGRDVWLDLAWALVNSPEFLLRH